MRTVTDTLTQRPCALIALAILTACALALTAPRPAAASDSQLSLVLDDNAFIYGFDNQRDAALDRIKTLGADGVRVTVSWAFLAGNLKHRPRRLRGRRAERPSGYSRLLWDRFDRLLVAAQARGLLVLFNITGPGPMWANAPTNSRIDRQFWKPSAAGFGQFVKAVATRYSGSYRDENDGRRILPRAGFWSIWNEPNQPAGIAPQVEYDKRVRHNVPFAPIRYRELYYAATSALRATGHASDVIMMGETAPLGNTTPGRRIHLWPKLFLREMFCIGSNGARYHGLEAKVRHCDELKRHGPFLVNAFAHHPYSQKNPPTHRDADRDSINMANIGELPVLLDHLADKTGLIKRGLPVALTEIGWQTLPPDPVDGISLARQAAYINVADHMAYENPRIFAQTQFLLSDVAPRTQYRVHDPLRWSTWQSGLLFRNGKPKPALYSFLMPIDVQRGGAAADGGVTLHVWGQVRAAAYGATETVQLQFRPAGSKLYDTVGAPVQVTNPLGFYETTLTGRSPGSYRALWDVAGAQLSSREVSVSP